MKNNKNKKLADILHVIKLAKLTLNESQKVRFLKQLEEILGYVGRVKSLNTDNIETTAQVTGLKNVFREDKVKTCLTQAEALKNAPQVHNGCFKVKNVFED